MHRVRRKRPDLRLIISSATIDAQAFVNFFNTNVDSEDRSKVTFEFAHASKKADLSQDDATIISLEGRMYPVDVAYLSDPTNNYVASAVQAVMDIHLHVRRAHYLLP